MYIHADITKEKSIKNLVDTIKTKYTINRKFNEIKGLIKYCVLNTFHLMKKFYHFFQSRDDYHLAIEKLVLKMRVRFFHFLQKMSLTSKNVFEGK